MSKVEHKYMSKYKPEFPEMLIAHMAKGLSFESFGAIANCSKQAMFVWVQKHKEFREAKALGEVKGRYFWEVQGTKGMIGQIQNFSATVWIFTMKCRFGYRDGSETGEQTDTKKDKVVYKATWGKSSDQ